MRRLAFAALAAWAAAAVLIVLPVAAPAADPPPTAIKTFVPTIPPGKARAGSCWTTSIADSRPGAYRCMVGNEIMDPCFATKQPSIVVCAANPIPPVEVGFALKVTKPLPTETKVPGPLRPWIVQLADGTTCQPFTGTVLGYKETTVAFGCPPSTTGYMVGLLGTLKPGTTWMAQKILYKPGDQGQARAHSVTTVPVAVIWQ